MISLARRHGDDGHVALRDERGRTLGVVLRPRGPRLAGSGAHTVYLAPPARPLVHWLLRTPAAGVRAAGR